MKEITYEKERLFLSKYAAFSVNTLGRDREEESCPMRTDYQRDRDRIIHSKSFRRLKNKTQVFLSPEGDHYRTRLSHTLDVSQIARSISRCLSLNEDLTEAIALGHDLGHTPFGHSGERVLNTLAPCGFKHNEQSVRVVEVLENDGKGLNLTKEVRDGILNHKKDGNPRTLEGRAVSIADRIAYINHDIDDAVRAGILKMSELPKREIEILGDSSSKRINTMIMSIYKESNGQNHVKMEEEILQATENLRKFMFERVYITEESKREEAKAYRMLSAMFNYFLKDKDKLPSFYLALSEKYELEKVICDYLSSMSDKYAVYIFENIFVPKSWTLQQ